MAFEEFDYVYTTKLGTEAWDANEYNIQNVGYCSGGGTFGRDSSQATMVYLCEYNFVEQFVDVVMGRTVHVDGTLRRSALTPDITSPGNGSLPEEHPYFYNYYAATCSVSPKGTSSQEVAGPLWNKAIVSVVFRPNDYNVIPDEEDIPEIDRFTTKTSEPVIEFQTSNCTTFKFVSNGNVVPINPPMVLPSTRLTYTWRQIPVGLRLDGYPDLGTVPNIDVITGLMGKVNSTQFDIYPPGTVLFTGFAPKLILPSTANENGHYWDEVFQFTLRNYGPSAQESGKSIGWNYVWNISKAGGTPGWDLITTTGVNTGPKQYAYADLNDLFNPATW